MKVLLVIFSGYNQRAIIAFLRVLKKNYIDEYSIIASSKSDPIFLTDYKEKVFYTRKKVELDREELMNALCLLKTKKGAESIMIVPSTESLNRFFLLNRVEFALCNINIPLVHEQIYKTISDKESFWKICKEALFDVPQIFKFPIKFGKEFVAKPKSYIGRDGKQHSPELIFSENDFANFKEKNLLDDFTYQEFIRGESCYLLYYMAKNGKTYKFSQVNFLQQSNGKSILMAAPDKIHNESIAEYYEGFLRNLGFWGFIMIELRKINSQYVMIEANPRFWGPSQLIVDSGVPLFEAFLFDLNILASIPDRKINWDAKYCWSTGVKNPFEKVNDCFWHEGGMLEVIGNKNKYLEYDIYNRFDTHGIYELERKQMNGC